MKKLLGVILAIVMLTSCMFTLGCSKEIEGTYKFDYMTMYSDGVEIELEAGEKYMGMYTLSENFVTLVLKEDGSCIFSMSMGDEGLMSGTWRQEDDELIITIDGEEDVMEIDGDKLIMEDYVDGQKLKIVLSK